MTNHVDQAIFLPFFPQFTPEFRTRGEFFSGGAQVGENIIFSQKIVMDFSNKKHLRYQTSFHLTLKVYFLIHIILFKILFY